MRTHAFPTRLVLTILIGVMGLCPAGCRRSGPERIVVRGTIAYDGSPIERGFIRFFPIDDTSGPMWGAQILAGNYVADGKGGVPVGTHRVEIEAFRIAPGSATGDDIFEDLGEGSSAGREIQFIPEKYNSRSELQLEVPSRSDPIQADFDLEP